MFLSKKYLLGILIFLAAFEFALLGLNPTFYIDDSPEIITVAAGLGVPHPPGYPLLMLVGRLMALLPFPVCFGVNVLSALLAALTCLLLYILLNRQFKVPTTLSLAFAILWMAGASAYPSALSAKRGVYELAGVFVLAILACLLGGRLKLAAFLYGLSLGGHWMSMATYGPGLAFLAYERARQKPWTGRDWTQAALFFGIGLSIYLYLPLRAVHDPMVNWGYPANLVLFLKHVTRYIDKGRDFSPSIGQWLKGWGYYIQFAFLEYAGVGLLALAGIFFEWKVYRRRALGLALAWAGLVGAVGVFSNYSGKRLPLLEDYSVSSWVFLALFSGLGAWGLLRLWEKGRAFTPVLGALLLALCLGGVGYRVAHNGQSRYTCGYDYTLNAWKPLPKNALFFCEGDYLQFPCWYFQWVEGRRSDLCVIGSSLCMDCNRIQMARDHPGLKVPYPNHDPDKTYYFGALDSWMMKNNPQRRCFFTFPPKFEGVENLNQAPLGLTREGIASPQKPFFDQASNDSFWSNARIRSLRPEASVDIRTWNTVLQDYGAKRLALALYEMNRAADLENSGPGNSPKAREWYEKSLANLFVIKDWIPPGSRKTIDGGVKPEKMGDLLPDVFFHRSIFVTIGAVYTHLGDLEQARVWIQQGTQNVLRDSDVYFFTGLVAYEANNLPEARKWLNKTLEMDPYHPQAGQILQIIDQKLGS